MFITSLILLIGNYTNVIEAATASRPSWAYDRDFLQALIDPLKHKETDLKQKHAILKEPKKEAKRIKGKIKKVKKKLKILQDELLIIKCHSIGAISFLVNSFLMPSPVPIVCPKTTENEYFIRKGCDECATNSASYLSITSQGTVSTHGHYLKEVSTDKTFKILPSQLPIESEELLECPLLKNPLFFNLYDSERLKKVVLNHEKEEKQDIVLEKTFLNNRKRTIKINKQTASYEHVHWFQQCYNPQANRHCSTEYTCKKHFIVATSVGTYQNKVFIWSKEDGRLQSAFTFPSHMYLLEKAYSATKTTAIPCLLGIDGFLWLRNTWNNSIERLDVRGVRQKTPYISIPQSVDTFMSLDGHWHLNRLQTHGIQTTFCRTYLPIPKLTLQKNPQQNYLLEATTAVWLDTLFEKINISQDSITMHPRWILRYRNLKKILKTHELTIDLGLHNRVKEGAGAWLNARNKVLKAARKQGIKRKQYE